MYRADFLNTGTSSIVLFTGRWKVSSCLVSLSIFFHQFLHTTNGFLFLQFLAILPSNWAFSYTDRMPTTIRSFDSEVCFFLQSVLGLADLSDRSHCSYRRSLKLVAPHHNAKYRTAETHRGPSLICTRHQSHVLHCLPDHSKPLHFPLNFFFVLAPLPNIFHIFSEDRSPFTACCSPTTVASQKLV